MGNLIPVSETQKCPKGPQKICETAYRLVGDLTSHSQLKMFRPGQSRYPGWSAHRGITSSSVTEISVAKTKISEPGQPTSSYRNFCKEKSGEARSRKPRQPGRLGSYEEGLSLLSTYAALWLLYCHDITYYFFT